MNDLHYLIEKEYEKRRVWELVLYPDVEKSHEELKAYLMRNYICALFVSHDHEESADKSRELKPHIHVFIKLDRAVTRYGFYKKVIEPAGVDYKYLYTRPITDNYYNRYLEELPDSDGIRVVPLKFPHKDYKSLERIASKHHVDVIELLHMVIYDYLEVGDSNE